MVPFFSSSAKTRMAAIRSLIVGTRAASRSTSSRCAGVRVRFFHRESCSS
jgi:hypothetical protein